MTRIVPDTLFGPDAQVTPDDSAGTPGGGGFGALMSNKHFQRYEVDGKWRGVKRVRVSKRSS